MFKDHSADDGLIRPEQLGNIGALEHQWVTRLAAASIFMEDNHVIVDDQLDFIGIAIVLGVMSADYCFVRVRQGSCLCLMNRIGFNHSCMNVFIC